MATKGTRSSTAHPLFGQPANLPPSQLPTGGDICRMMLQIAQEEKSKSSGRFPDRASMEQQAANAIINKWEEGIMDKKGSSIKLPIITKRGVMKKIKTLYDTGLKWSKTPLTTEGKMKNDNFKVYIESLDKLFDICSCKCPMDTNSCAEAQCTDKECNGFHIKCKCEIKVPKREIEFLCDQRGPRLMFIGKVDVKVSHMWKRTAKRAQKVEEWYKDMHVKQIETQQEEQATQNELFATEEEAVHIDTEAEDSVTDPDFQPSRPVSFNLGTQNRFRWRNAALACDRFGISDRAGACVITATLMDCGCVTQDDQQKVVSHTKLHKERHLARVEQQKEEWHKRESITSFYFDGKKDATLTKQNVNGKWYPSVQLEEHYVVVDGNDFVTHVTPKSGHAINVAKALFNAAMETESIDSIIVLGCDGTNVNTGWKNGILYNLQCMLGHECQIAVCMLHGNELPFRAIFHHYDGTTSGPSSFNGSIGKQLKEELSSKEIISFQAISFSEFPILEDEVIADLSWDQKLLYKYCQAIISGTCSIDLELLEPGPVFHSRWLTLWARILRLYMCTSKPSYKLKRLVSVIVKFSAPMWFNIKCSPNIADGARHVFKAVQLLKNLTPTEIKIAKKTVQRNAYFAHHEWVLLTMLSDVDQTVRSEAIKVIQRIRKGKCNMRSEQDEVDADDGKSGGAKGCSDKSSSEDELGEQEVEEDIPMNRDIRYYKVPQLNWNATSYVTVINLKSVATTEPPLTRHLTDEDLQSVIHSALQVPKYPSHTQAVERAIKVVSDACSQVYYKERDGFIRQRIRARKLMPKVNTKKDFATLFETLHINE